MKSGSEQSCPLFGFDLGISLYFLFKGYIGEPVWKGKKGVTEVS